MTGVAPPSETVGDGGAVGGGGWTRGGVVNVVTAGVWGHETSTPSAPTVGGEATPTDKTPTSGRPGKTVNQTSVEQGHPHVDTRNSYRLVT